MTDPKPCPLCDQRAAEAKFGAGSCTCSSKDCPLYIVWMPTVAWNALPRRPTVEELAEKLAKIPPKMWAEAQDSNDERIAWRAIAEEILK